VANVNCLEGKRCPKCGNEDSFMVLCLVWRTVHDDGTDEPDNMHGNTEYDEDSPAICTECKFEGNWGEFDVPEPASK
jgi:hypothetical protein